MTSLAIAPNTLTRSRIDWEVSGPTSDILSKPNEKESWEPEIKIIKNINKVYLQLLQSSNAIKNNLTLIINVVQHV